MEKIIHIVTGGTIGGCVPEFPDIERLSKIFPDTPDIKRYLKESFQIHAEYSEIVVCYKDSREIDELDRDKILKAVTTAFEAGITKMMITHGTFTMPETGTYLIDNLPKEILSQISVVITGSMYPLNMIGSDALLNVGATIGVLTNTTQPLGVVINMHGKNWNPEKVRKNVSELIFEEITK